MTALLKKRSALEMAIELAKESRQNYIDVIKLAARLGVGVFVREMESDENAFIEYKADTKQFNIYVNPKHSKQRQRFSIAHELSHFILHPEKIQKYRRVDRKGAHSLDLEEEKKADELAAEILMPEPLVRRCLKKLKISSEKAMTKSAIESIADGFNVSPLVAIMRLRKLGHYVPYIAY